MKSNLQSLVAVYFYQLQDLDQFYGRFFQVYFLHFRYDFRNNSKI